MIYIAVFLTTAFLTYIYEHSKKNRKNKYILILLVAILIILLPSLLGGLRDIEVGTDNINYNKAFKFCYNKDLSFLLSADHEIPSAANFEKGFVILLWLLSRFGNDFFIFAFGTSLITFTFIFLSLDYFRERYSMTVMILIYFFIFCCNFFNYVRQGIAFSIVLFSLRYVEKKQPFKYFISLLFAMSFHRSAVCAILIYPIFYLVEKISLYKLLAVVVGIFVVIFIAGPQLLGKIINNLIQQHILSSGYGMYVDMLMNIASYRIPLSIVGRSLPQVVASSVFYKDLSKSDTTIKGYYFMIWIQLFFTIIGSSDFAGFLRLSIYFNISEIILLAAIVKRLSMKKLKWPAYGMLMGYLLTYWIVFTVLNFEHFRFPTYPYILGV